MGFGVVCYIGAGGVSTRKIIDTFAYAPYMMLDGVENTVEIAEKQKRQNSQNGQSTADGVMKDFKKFNILRDSGIIHFS